MVKNQKEFNPREYMEKAIEVMKESIHEPRDDKASPAVGSVLLKPDDTVDTAYRGEIRHGDHAEYTLLDKKNRNKKLDNSLLFATLEPCAPGARSRHKLSCAKRIVNARIKKVWVGIEDPDPMVDRKGIKYLQDNGIEVEMFDADLQEKIRDYNKKFIKQAEKRARKAEEEEKEIFLSNKEKAEVSSNVNDLSKKAVQEFIKKSDLDVSFDDKEFNRIFVQLGLLEETDGDIKPTGIGLLLFGERPQLKYPHALIRATYKTEGRDEDIYKVEGPLVKQADLIEKWYEPKIGKQIDRSEVHRRDIYDYPLKAIRESIVNAIVHRDYDIEEAPILFEINDDAFVIKSPGKPVSGISLKQIQNFNAPTLSRNPKIMYIFDQLGLVEQRGLGFKTFRELPEKYDLPLPEITYEKPYIVLTLPRNTKSIRKVSSNEAIKELNDTELKGYEWIRSQDEIATKDYASEFDVSQRTASRHLHKMLDLGLIETNNENLNSPKLRYRASL